MATVSDTDLVRRSLLDLLARTAADGSLEKALHDAHAEKVEEPAQQPTSPTRRPSYEAIQAARKAGAGVGVNDLLAEFQEELSGSPQGPAEEDPAEVSFDLSTSPSNEDGGGGFFISAGGGGLNLPLEEDDPLKEEIGMWIPSTYQRLHVGSSATFRHLQGSAHRIDYALVGGTAMVWAAKSSVAENFDTLNSTDDHTPAVLELHGALEKHTGGDRIWRPTFDTERMLTPEGRATIAEALSAFESPSWQCHPDMHCQALQDYLLGVLQTHFGRDEAGPRASFLSADVWTVRTAKLALKRRSRHRAGLWADLLSRAFRQWSRQEDYSVLAVVRKHGFIYELVASAIQFATGRIKLAIRADKNAFLDRIAQGGHAKATEILGVAKRAGIGGRQARPMHRPLPALLTPDGTLSSSRADRDETWLQQFSQQEFGSIVPTAEYLRRPGEPIAIDAAINWRLEDVPSYFEGRPCGDDTDSLPPLLEGLPLTLYQPVQWRGGLLRESWKRKGTVQDPENYRSLFVSSMLGKTFHKVLRKRATQHAADMLLGFQMGARRHAPSAYYTVIREMSVGLIENEETVAKVFKYFGLAPNDLAEFWGDVHGGGIMGQSNMPCALRHMAKDLLHRSWFVTGYGNSDRLCVTQAGSRPGEAWADLVFAFVLGKILCRIREVAVGEGLLQALYVDPDSGPYAQRGDGAEVHALECAWADDAAFPISDASPSSLLTKATRLCSVVLHECARHGLQPNLKPGKTAILLALRGRGSRKVRQQWFPNGRNVLVLRDLGLEVPVVGAYNHLGGTVDMAMSGKGEARRRLAIMQSTFDEGKRLLYGNASIPLLTRSALFQTSVVATLFNLGLWVPVGAAWLHLAGGFTRVLRGLLTKQFTGDLLYNVAAPAVHILTNCFPLEMFARRSRLSLLASACKAAPDELWAMLQTEQAWFATVRDDLRWLCEDENDCPTADAAGWPAMHRLLTHRTTWIKTRVRKLLNRDFKAFCVERMIDLQLWALYRRLLQAHPRWRPAGTWCCRPCGRRVKTKAALGAHFHKVHGRLAKHRPFVDGTVCHACGRQYWSVPKLADHLRDHPGCVATLRLHGRARDKALPGRGSKVWRKQAEETCLAVSGPHGAPLPAAADAGWDDTTRRAYKEVCEALLVDDLPADSAMLVDLIAKSLGRHPLFESEEHEIVAHVGAEVRQLRKADADDHWSDEVYAALCHSTEHYVIDTQPSELEARTEIHTDSLQAFSQRLSAFDWADALSQAKPAYETQEGALYTLHSWDVALTCDREALTLATVGEMYWPLLPEALREAWDAAVQGRNVRLAAPNAFWEHRLSLPFKGMRADDASN
ncbi:unnamed protein product [Symbiodinium sp. CCMP2592]|nr:unnamed protein product [Symbiodinium sp. CCMP2592]